MSTKSHLQTLFNYHWHTTQQLLALAGQLRDEEVTAVSEYGRSIHALFFHILRTDEAWRQGLQTGERQPPLPAEKFPDLASLQSGFQQEQDAWNDYFINLQLDEMEDSSPFPPWRVIYHVLLHGMQHHAELAHLLTTKGYSPGDIDFIFFSEENSYG